MSHKNFIYQYIQPLIHQAILPFCFVCFDTSPDGGLDYLKKTTDMEEIVNYCLGAFTVIGFGYAMINLYRVQKLGSKRPKKTELSEADKIRKEFIKELNNQFNK